MDEVFKSDFITQYKECTEKLGKLQPFGNAWICSLIDEQEWKQIVSILEETQFIVDNDLADRLFRTGHIEILKYLHSHGHDISKRRIQEIPINPENIPWLLQFNNPNELFHVSMCRYDLDNLFYLVRNCPTLPAKHFYVMANWFRASNGRITVDNFVSLLNEMKFHPITNTDIAIYQMHSNSDPKIIEWLEAHRF